MNEQIKVNVPDGFHAVQNANGEIDIVPGPGPGSPTVTVEAVREKYRYEYWSGGWSTQTTTAWAANNMADYRGFHRPEANQVVRGIRAVAVISVEVAADDWGQVERLVDDVERQIANINSTIE